MSVTAPIDEPARLVLRMTASPPAVRIFPNASRNVAVSVDVVGLPFAPVVSIVVGTATMVDVLPETAAATTVTLPLIPVRLVLSVAVTV